jgi:recombinational DNA repair ATPase RecF
VRQDSVAALSFINEQPEGGVRDQAASSYVMANQTGKVEDNLALAETIGDERTRERAVGMTVAGWMRQDPEAAKSYLDSTEALSERSKKRISHWIR